MFTSTYMNMNLTMKTKLNLQRLNKGRSLKKISVELSEGDTTVKTQRK